MQNNYKEPKRKKCGDDIKGKVEVVLGIKLYMMCLVFHVSIGNEQIIDEKCVANKKTFIPLPTVYNCYYVI